MFCTDVDNPWVRLRELKNRLIDKVTSTIGESISLPLPLKSPQWVSVSIEMDFPREERVSELRTATLSCDQYTTSTAALKMYELPAALWVNRGFRPAS